MEYILHLLIMICIYTILSQSLSLVAGYSGQISLAHAGFYGIGAYVTALLSVNFGTPPLLNLLLAMLFSGILAFIVAKVAVKTIDDYYVIITLGIQVVMFSIMNNWQSVTNGPLGIAGIPPFSVFGMKLESTWSFLLLSVILTATVWFVLHNITKSPFGKMLQALSEDEVYTGSLGKNVSNAKVVSFVISGMLASIAGVLYAHYVSYIDPTSFALDESIFILSIVIIGGMRNLRGIFLAATFLVLLPEALRFVGLPSSIAANIRQIVYGVALVLIIFGNKKRHCFNLQRFLDAQEHDYPRALREIKNGLKQSQWIWYVFPQLKGWKLSYNSQYYGLEGIDEARAYYDHPVLRERLIEITTALLEHKDKSAVAILSPKDARKVKSCMTLFWLVSENPVFKSVLDVFYEGQMDDKVVRLFESTRKPNVACQHCR